MRGIVRDITDVSLVLSLEDCSNAETRHSRAIMRGARLINISNNVLIFYIYLYRYIE